MEPITWIVIGAAIFVGFARLLTRRTVRA